MYFFYILWNFFWEWQEMRKPTFLLAGLILTILVCVCATAAAIEPTGPFRGKFSEGFETQQDSFATELPVFEGESTVRNLFDGPYLHVSGCWTGIGTVCARSGDCFMGSVGGGVEWIFDVPAGRFGGYFTVLDLLPNTEGAVAYFYDVNDNLLAQMDVNAPYSTWIWNGWVSDVPIKRIEIIGLGSPGWLDLGGFVMHDDMEYTPFGEPGTIYYVDDDATGANDGSSWEDAFVYLQDALAAVHYGDEILVAQGIYKPDQGAGVTAGDREATFQLINGVTLKGGYGGADAPDPDARDVELYETVLSGDLNGDDGPDFANNGENSCHVVTGSGTDETAVLDGFTITGGNANGPYPKYVGGGLLNYPGSPIVDNCTFIGNYAINGGGMYNHKGSRPKLADCTFTQNLASDGAGMYNNYYSTPTVTDCFFSDNRADSEAGAAYYSLSNSTLENCTFTRNTADYEGGAMYIDRSDLAMVNCSFSENSAPVGGGLYNYDSDPVLTNCVFSDNFADNDGGGVCNEEDDEECSPRFINCAFSRNEAGDDGGAVSNFSDCNVTLISCTFGGNIAAGSGGGVYSIGWTRLNLHNCVLGGNLADNGGAVYNTYNVNAAIVNCTFADNSAYEGNALACDSRSSPPSSVRVTNCIIWDGDNAIWNNDGSTITITYSDVQGGWPGEGNIDIDPLFADAIGSDYHIRTGSPCIDAGTDAGVYEDIEGNVRPFDFTAIDNNGELADFDMGAYEAVSIEGELKMVPRTVNRRSNDGQVIAVMQLPLSDAEDDIAADEPLVLLPGDIKAVEQKIMPKDGGELSKLRIRAVFYKAELLEAIPDNGEADVTIIGRFISGRHFYGTDIIRIISSQK